MKNLFFATLVTIFGFTTINAQSDDTTAQFGVKGGVNFSTITGDDIGDLDSRTSFNLGLFMEIPISERFSFQPEVLYSGQGFTIATRDQDNAFDTDDNVEYQLNYIQVPLMAKVYLVKGLYAEAGPQFGFKVSEEIDYSPGEGGGDTVIDSDDSHVKGFDTNVALGAGYKFDNGFALSARYTHGLTNIYKDNTMFENTDAKNSVWQFGVAFSF
ncbi:outer membrane protein with beta-barrel domain [Gelidibacter sediminis]|uniref:Outer membrane protein with beta-barrel domain n=1 Tax=Gelidibacter sediminis TaxID=1608710 RepID=A0A4V3F8G1_9FLAO|nr:porin family protein [Gelidibacter sediminis]TDU40246.1 outer membrane protein with beta-barrel domain [Gelidibacter sediminis]